MSRRGSARERDVDAVAVAAAAGDEAVGADDVEAVDAVDTVDAVEPVQARAAKPSAMGLKPLDRLERRVSFGVALVGAALTIGLWIPFFEAGGAVWMPVGLVLSAALAWSSLKAGRMATGIAAFLMSFAVFPVPLVGFPFLILGLWLWFRGRPSQEEIAERRRVRMEANAARRAAKRGEPPPVASDGRRRPAPSKRYTPPAQRKR